MIYKDNLAAMAVREDVRNLNKRPRRTLNSIKISFDIYKMEHEMYKISAENKDNFLGEVRKLVDKVIGIFRLDGRARSCPSPLVLHSEGADYTVRGLWVDNYEDLRNCTFSEIRQVEEGLEVEILKKDRLTGLDPTHYVALVKKHGKIVDSHGLIRRTS